MSLKCLIADAFASNYIKKLEEAGLEIIYQPKYGEKDLIEAAKDVDILVVRSTKVNAETIKNSDHLGLIIRAGSGYNTIDIAEANKKGVYVANCPGKNAIAVAELAMGLILSLDRRIPDNVIDFRNGKWNKGEYSKANGLFGRNLVIIGVGNIGKELANRAVAFGMKVYGKDIVQIDGLPIEYFTDLEAMIPKADVISLHLPSNPQTRGLFNEKMFGLMKNGSLLINTSRADIIDEAAMAKAIKEKGIRVALDVFSGEPEAKQCEISSELQNTENLYITHHIGASTEQAQNAVADETVKIILHYLKTGVVLNWVNKAKVPGVHFQLNVKHWDRPGVLANIMEILKEGNINIEEVENVIFDGGLIAQCTMRLKSQATDVMLERIRAKSNVIQATQLEVE